jgi:uncharacterized protein
LFWKCCSAVRPEAQEVTLKYLLVLVVVLVVAWMLLRRREPPPPVPKKNTRTDAGRKPAVTQPMLACAHCGIHVPQAEVQMDAAGRPFCSEAHRLAGPR